MPSKPARYGLKFWVACDAKSSYAWNVQLYAGKPDGAGAREKNLSARVVLDLTRGLPAGSNVTCDNFFTSYGLAAGLLRERGVTLVGTLRANRTEVPRALLDTARRAVRSSVFAFTPEATVVSYLARRNRNVLLLSTAHAEPAVDPGRADGKPDVVLDYNANKGGVDNLDKAVAAYSCRRMTARWPVAVFHALIDVSAYNAFVLWRELRPDWMPGRKNKRRVFLEQLGRALVTPQALSRRFPPRAEPAASLARSLGPAPPGDRRVRREGRLGGGRGNGGGEAERRERFAGPGEPGKRKRCQVCPAKRDRKTRTVCRACGKYVCGECCVPHCPACSRALAPAGPEEEEEEEEDEEEEVHGHRSVPPERRVPPTLPPGRGEGAGSR